jgi:hypothetical protein
MPSLIPPNAADQPADNDLTDSQIDRLNALEVQSQLAALGHYLVEWDGELVIVPPPSDPHEAAVYTGLVAAYRDALLALLAIQRAQLPTGPEELPW